MINVLYVHHCGIYGGASRSLFEAISNFPQGKVKPYLITQKGNVSKIAKEMGMDVIEIQGLPSVNNSTSQHKGIKSIIIYLREFIFLFSMFYGIRKAKKLWGHNVDIIHINDITLTIPAIFFKLCFKRPIVLHARCVQENKTNIKSKLIKKIIDSFIQKVISIDLNVDNSLPNIQRSVIIHNGFAFKKIENLKKEKSNKIKIGIVSNFLKFKGIYEFVEAAKICILDYDIKNIEFLFYGDNPRETKGIKAFLFRKLGFVQDAKANLKEYIDKNGLIDKVIFKGFEKSLEKVFSSFDVLCFPSHLEGAGRPVFEAAFYGVPSIVAITDPQLDTIIHNETGICIQPKSSKALADAIKYFYNNPSEIERMGKNANELAWKNFDIKRNALKLLNVYKEVLEKNMIKREEEI